MPSKTTRTKLRTAFLLLFCPFAIGQTNSHTPDSQSPKTPTSVRESDRRCGGCHADIYNSYLQTPMANASGPAAEQLKPGTFIHAKSHVKYTISLANAQPELTYQSADAHDPPPSQPSGSIPLSYFLGSGHLGTTWLYSTGNYLFESPIAWYAASQHYDMKPGLVELDHMPPPLSMQSGCMRCHMSAVQPSDPGTMNRYAGLPFFHYGITCEACHGDSDKHVAAAGKAPIVNPAHLSADARDSVCISCHLEGDISIERAGHSALNYRPGESISTYLAFYVRAGANLTDRGVSEVEQLSRSTCKRRSGDRMACTTCHDPHQTPDAQRRVAFYRSKCLTCHSEPAFAQTHHPENQDCTSCHMPRAAAANILHVAWTDHRILRQPNPTNAQPPATTGRLTPIFSPDATERDQAMADYQAFLEGDPSLAPVAWKELSALEPRLSDDKDALNALGTLAAERGDFPTAGRAFHRVLALDPVNLTAQSNYGILLAKDGKLTESVVVLLSAFQRNQDVPGLAVNLARIQCILSDARGARETLNTALTYAPTSTELQQVSRQLGFSCGAEAGK